MLASLTQSLENFIAISGLVSGVAIGAIGVGFFFAGLKIRGEIKEEVEAQIREISTSQLRGQFEDSRLAQLLIELQKEIDGSKAILVRHGHEIYQIQGFLVKEGYARRRRPELRGREPEQE